MKLIIEIDEARYNDIQRIAEVQMDLRHFDTAEQIIAKGISLEQELTTGHWFIDENPESNREVICSNCKQSVFKYHKMDFDYRPKFCPNCGCKMSEIPAGLESDEQV